MATAGPCLGVLVLATAVSTWQAVRAIRAEASALAGEHRADEQAGLAQREAARADVERGRAVREAAKQEAVNRFLNDMLSRASPRGPTTGPAAAVRVKGESVTVLEVVKEAVRKLDAGSMIDHPEIEARLRMTVADIYWDLGAGDEIAQAQMRVRLNQQCTARIAPRPRAAWPGSRISSSCARGGPRPRPSSAPSWRRSRSGGKPCSRLSPCWPRAGIDGKLAEADRLYREASLAKRPGEAGGFPWVPAEILWDAGRLAEAETLYRSILASTRSDPERDDRTLEFVLRS